MATEHLCNDHPLEPGTWQEGPVSSCIFHNKRRAIQGVKWGRKIRRQADLQAGVIGTDRGDFISGK